MLVDVAETQQNGSSSVDSSSFVCCAFRLGAQQQLRRRTYSTTLFSSILLLLSLLLLVDVFLPSSSPTSSSSSLVLPASAAKSLLGPQCAPSNATLRVGVFLCNSSSVLVCAVQGIDLLLDTWVRHVNERRCGLLGQGLAVQIVPRTLSSSAANSSEILAATTSMLADDLQPDGSRDPTRKGVHAVMLPSGSTWTAAMELLEANSVPAVAALSPTSFLYQCSGPAGPAGTGWTSQQSSCRAANTRRFQFAHSIASPGEKYFLEWVGLLQLKGARTLSAVSTSLALYGTVIKGLSIAAADAHIEIVESFLSLPILPGSSSVAQNIVDETVDKLKALNADAVVILASDCRPWIHRLKAVNYLPKSLATLLCTDSPAALAELGPALNYVVGPAQWDPHLSGAEYEETNSTTPWGMFLAPEADETDTPSFSFGEDGYALSEAERFLQSGADAATVAALDPAVVSKWSSPLQFVNTYQRAFGRGASMLPGYDAASTLAALVMLEGALETADSGAVQVLSRETGALFVDRVAVNRALQLHYSPSFFGLLSTDRYGMNQQKTLPILQRNSLQQLRIIAPSRYSSMDFIYPMPRWDERVYVHSLFALPVEQTFIALALGCCLFTLALASYLFKHRERQIFQAAGVGFYMLMAVGAIASYVSILTWPVENNAATCGARIWIWTLAFQSFVAPMVSCAYRIARIYSVGLVSVRVSNGKVAAYCLALATPQLIINVLWTTLAPLKPKVVELDPLRPVSNYTICSADASLTNVFSALTLVYCGAMLLAACGLAWRVRKAYSIFNDAKPIALSMYTITIAALVGVSVQLALNEPELAAQKVLFGLRSAGVLLAYQASLAILFLRRMLDQFEFGTTGGASKGAREKELLQNTFLGTAFGDQSAHMKTEISQVLWRNDLHHKVSALRARPVIQQPPPPGGGLAGLFSRGGSSAPPTPILRAFGSTTQQGDVLAAGAARAEAAAAGIGAIGGPTTNAGGSPVIGAVAAATVAGAVTAGEPGLLVPPGAGANTNGGPAAVGGDFTARSSTVPMPTTTGSPHLRAQQAPSSGGAGASSVGDCCVTHHNDDVVAVTMGQSVHDSGPDEQSTGIVGAAPANANCTTIGGVDGSTGASTALAVQGHHLHASSSCLMPGQVQTHSSLGLDTAFAADRVAKMLLMPAGSTAANGVTHSKHPTQSPSSSLPVSSPVSGGDGANGAPTSTDVVTKSSSSNGINCAAAAHLAGSLPVNVSGAVFSLPTVAEVRALQPSHFFTWRAHVHHQLALLSAAASASLFAASTAFKSAVTAAGTTATGARSRPSSAEKQAGGGGGSGALSPSVAVADAIDHPLSDDPTFGPVCRTESFVQPLLPRAYAVVSPVPEGVSSTNSPPCGPSAVNSARGYALVGGLGLGTSTTACGTATWGGGAGGAMHGGGAMEVSAGPHDSTTALTLAHMRLGSPELRSHGSWGGTGHYVDGLRSPSLAGLIGSGTGTLGDLSPLTPAAPLSPGPQDHEEQQQQQQQQQPPPPPSSTLVPSIPLSTLDRCGSPAVHLQLPLTNHPHVRTRHISLSHTPQPHHHLPPLLQLSMQTATEAVVMATDADSSAAAAAAATVLRSSSMPPSSLASPFHSVLPLYDASASSSSSNPRVVVGLLKTKSLLSPSAAAAAGAVAASNQKNDNATAEKDEERKQQQQQQQQQRPSVSRPLVPQRPLSLPGSSLLPSSAAPADEP